VSFLDALNRVAGGLSDPARPASALILVFNPLQEGNEALVAHLCQRMHCCMADTWLGIGDPCEQQIHRTIAGTLGEGPERLTAHLDGGIIERIDEGAKTSPLTT